jgi:predicted NBD/HSP70 family sugar kinase
VACSSGIADGTALLGLGAALPAMVGGDGLVRFSPSLAWRDVPFAAMILERLPVAIPVTLANDADMGALGEHARGAGANADHMVFVGCDDRGVGGGIIINGRPFRGVGGFAGEFGHLAVNPRGRPCGCGSAGCWETEIGAVPVAAALGLDTSDPDEVAKLLATVEQPSAQLRTIGRFLGLGLASIVNAFNTELVVLGGTLRYLYPVVKADADATFKKAALSAPRGQVQLVLAQLGREAPLIGAAEAVIDALFSDPAGVLAAAHRGPLDRPA